MGVKVVAMPCLQWSQSSVPHSPSIITLYAKKRALNDVALACRPAGLGTMSSKLRRSCSFEQQRSSLSIPRACSDGFESFSDEEFSRKIEDLALRFQQSGDDAGEESIIYSETETGKGSDLSSIDEMGLRLDFEAIKSSVESRWLEIQHEPPDWAVNIEMKANSVDLPLSLRMIKRKINQQWQEGILEASESAYCSVKKAFSSMVFIIRELHSYTLQMRELLFYEDLKGILARVQSEIHASFVWLFQQVFSHTPTLMVYVMILLANFTVHSMSNSAAIAHTATPPAITTTMEERETPATSNTNKFDSSLIKSFSLSSGAGKTTSVGGGNGGGSKSKPVMSGMDGDGWANRSGDLHQPIVPDGVSPVATREEESVSGREEDEVGLWNSIVDEASRMQGHVRDNALDHETLQKFVSPVTVRIAGDQDYEEYFRTELLYQVGLAQEPNNVLLLANYAQFLCLVAHDYDRAEEYFKRAIKVEPKDAETHNKYANFLWHVRKDLWAAEETFLEAISAEPTNSFYAANYAHFLWNTGGEDTCFPLDSPDDNKSLD